MIFNESNIRKSDAHIPQPGIRIDSNDLRHGASRHGSSCDVEFKHA